MQNDSIGACIDRPMISISAPLAMKPFAAASERADVQLLDKVIGLILLVLSPVILAGMLILTPFEMMRQIWMKGLDWAELC
jgi:hypothetical protein